MPVNLFTEESIFVPTIEALLPKGIETTDMFTTVIESPGKEH
jgi:hypothetical protein